MVTFVHLAGTAAAFDRDNGAAAEKGYFAVLRDRKGGIVILQEYHSLGGSELGQGPVLLFSGGNFTGRSRSEGLRREDGSCCP